MVEPEFRFVSEHFLRKHGFFGTLLFEYRNIRADECALGTHPVTKFDRQLLQLIQIPTVGFQPAFGDREIVAN
jgi:hypothetical protein